MNSFSIIETTDERFAEEVRKVLPSYRFVPAQLNGRPVRMHVNLPFQFSLGG
jgi:hypothetical protein